MLQVDAAGRISTFAALPVSIEGECANLPNNTIDGVGCDPVPTGIVMGSDGFESRWRHPKRSMGWYRDTKASFASLPSE